MDNDEQVKEKNHLEKDPEHLENRRKHEPPTLPDPPQKSIAMRVPVKLRWIG